MCFGQKGRAKWGINTNGKNRKRVKERFVCMEVRLGHVREARVLDLWEGHLGITFKHHKSKIY